MSSDKLDQIFFLRERFMDTIRESKPGIIPDCPVDILSKEAQQALRDTALKGVEEMFEALGHLKNWKPHRTTEVKEFDREEFLEEVVDAFNYFFSLLIMTGVTSEELFEAYKKKDKIIHDRIRSGY